MTRRLAARGPARRRVVRMAAAAALRVAAAAGPRRRDRRTAARLGARVSVEDLQRRVDGRLLGFSTTPGDLVVGDVLRRKGGAMPELVHAHPTETVREAIDILPRVRGLQLPVVRAEPP